MQIINDMLNFINKNEISDSLITIEEAIGKKELRVVAIKILNWLKAQKRTSKNISLTIKNEHDWCKNLKHWLAHDALLANLFYIHENKYNFLPTVKENLRKKIRDTVDHSFKPPLMR